MSVHDHTFRFQHGTRKCEFVVWWSGDGTYAMDSRDGMYDDEGDQAVSDFVSALFYEKYGDDAVLKRIDDIALDVPVEVS